MSLKSGLRWMLRALLTGREPYVLQSVTPDLEGRFGGMDSIGLYLHIPFCRQICPYCPYNKQLFDPITAGEYTEAVIREIDHSSRRLAGIPISSFYIGGGTPTSMLHSGLARILEHVYRSFRMQCGIHLESHPNDLTPPNLDAIQALGVEFLSIGVEALQDRHLRTLRRPYTADEVRAAVGRAVARGFRCVNADCIFALPHQTYQEVEMAGKQLLALGVDQVAAYPLFTFPYTPWPQILRSLGNPPTTIVQRRRMLAILEDLFYAAGFERTSVWAFTRRGVPKYCSVTIPRYLGLGAGAGSYLDDLLYFNVFDVPAYIGALQGDRSPIALSLKLSRKMQLAGWLYWRVYETRFRKADFRERFGEDYDRVFGWATRILAGLGLLEDHGDEVVLGDDGTYWLHALQDLFSIDYVSRLWGISQQQPWPDRVVL